MSEYIGSRISLISKSDIKYVGILQSIDGETATVSLQEVRCHGTEGRKGNPNEEVPGSDVVYDGIVFRGSDVKDLTILAPPKENRQPQMPNDPAILGQTSEVRQPQQQQQQNQPPQQPPNQFRGPQPPYQQQQQFGYPGQPPNQFQPPPRFQGPGGAHGFPGQPGAVPGYGGYGPPPGYGMNMGYGPPQGPPPGQGFPPGHHGQFPPQQPIGPPGQHMNQQRPPQPPQQLNQQAPIGSKQNTPQPGTSQAPPPAAQAQSKPAEMSSTPAPTGPPPPIDSKPSAAAATAPPAQAPSQTQAPAVPKPASKINSRVAVPLASPAVPKTQPKAAAVAAATAPPAASLPLAQSAAPPQTATEAATAAVAAAMAKLGSINQQSGAIENLTQKVNQMRVQDPQARGRGRGRGMSGAPRGGRRESTQKTVEVPKEDFDFESANAKFNKQDLAKEAIATGSPAASPNGDKPDPFTNGHQDDAEDVVIPQSTEKGYDKKSSFFDNISSDLKDRVAQQSGEFVDGRAMRFQERSKNMETFGQGSVDGGYRGRGRGRGRGFSRGGRGFGGRGGFESRGGYRGRGRGGAEAAAV